MAQRNIGAGLRERAVGRPGHALEQFRHKGTSPETDQPITAIARRPKDHVSAAQRAKRLIDMPTPDGRDIAADKDHRPRRQALEGPCHTSAEITSALRYASRIARPKPASGGKLVRRDRKPDRPPGVVAKFAYQFDGSIAVEAPRGGATDGASEPSFDRTA